jgi:hypothetical protein
MRIAVLTTLFALVVTGAARAQATVIAVSGKVSIRRDGWSGWLPVRFGTAVAVGDLLHTDVGATLEVLCPDLTRRKLSGNETSGAPCGAAQSPTRGEAGGPRLGPLRSGYAEPQHELTLLRPRWTLLEETRPVIRWSAPPGVRSVQVTVVGVKFKWSTQATGTRMVYPANAPRLIPGRQYSVLVTALPLASTADGEAWPIFEVLTPEKVADLERRVAKIHALPLDAEKRAFLEGSFLANRGLRAEAIDRLRSLAVTSQEPAIHRVLASVYREVGLEPQAIASFRIAVARSASLADLDGEGQAAAMLGELCRRSGYCEKNEGQRHLGRAVAIYEQVGAQDEAKRLRGLL